MTVTPVMKKFILHWGEMGARWGINRTMAQIHALLFISPEPLDAEAVAAALGVARSNVSTSLRELQAWGVVRVVHVMGQRRDHFQCMKDVWEMFQVILDERKRREIDPTLAILRECLQLAQNARPVDSHTRDRLRDLLGFFETMCDWYGRIRRLPTGAVVKFVKLGGRVKKWLGLAS